MLSVNVVDTHEGFLSLESVWNQVLEKSNIDFPFLTFDWISVWWESFGAGSSMYVLLVKDGTDVIGIAPLMIQKTRFRGLPARTISFMANFHSNRADFIIVRDNEKVLRVIIEFLMNKRDMFDVLDFDFVPEKYATDTLMPQILRNYGIKFVRKSRIVSPYITIDKTWEEYLRTRPRNLRKKIHSIRNRQKKTNSTYTVNCYTKDNIADGMSCVFAISIKTWKYKNKTAIANSAGEKPFYGTLAERVGLLGWLCLYVLTCDGSPIAFEYLLKYRNKLFALKSSFDEDYRHLSPGVILFVHLLHDCFDSGIQEYDQLGNNEPHKMRWSNMSRAHYRYCVFASSMYGHFLYIVEKAIRCLRKIFPRSNYTRR